MISDTDKKSLMTFLNELSCFSSQLEVIDRSYSQPHRRYHTLEHVKFMLDMRDKSFQSFSPTPVPMTHGDVNLIQAIVYHDIYYDSAPQSLGVNEYYSAVFAQKQGCWAEVAHAIMATGYYMVDQRVLSTLAMELCDLDLANLALDYADYVYWSTLAIEEAMLIYFGGKAPSAVLFDGQINFCEMMLRRKKLYYRHSEWEDKARKNLHARIIELEEHPLSADYTP